MYILGIGGLGYKDSAAALLDDGRLVAAASEERFSGTKHEGGFPHRAVSACLDKAGISLRDVTTIAVADNPWLPMRDKVLQWYGEGFFRSRTANVYNVFKDETHRLVEYLKTLDDFVGSGVPVRPVPHDRSHFAAAFYLSPFESAAILNLDGRGEISTTGCGRGRGTQLTVDAIAHMPDSLGLLYALVADYLGFSDLDDEFRLISLSPTGDTSLAPKMRELVQMAGDGTCKLNPAYFGYHQKRAYLSEKFSAVFGPHHDPDLPLEDRHRDMAASLHAVVVDVVLQMARRLRQQTGERCLCLGGGLTLNWALVGALCESAIFDEIYLPPAPGDDGLAAGAALSVHFSEPGQSRFGALNRADLGPAFSETEIAEEVARLKLKATKPDHLADAVCDLITSGKIVGWFQGGAEFGPRALGHRSIFANPTDPGTRARLVASVKARSEFHPFGLSIAAESAKELFEDVTHSPFLERTGRLREAMRVKLPAVVAAGGRTRVQTVDQKRNPLFHELLLAVGRKTGVPAVLNTSLNEPGRPMATSPREAIGSLFTTGLDALALGPFILQK